MAGKTMIVKARYPIDDWEQIRDKMPGKTNTDILRTILNRELSDSKPKSNRDGIGLDDIDPNIIRIFCSSRLKHYDKQNLKWLEDQLKNKAEAPKILLLLNNLRQRQMKQLEESRSQSPKIEVKEYPHYHKSKQASLPTQAINEMKMIVLDRRNHNQSCDRELIRKILKERYPLEATMAEDVILDAVLSIL